MAPSTAPPKPRMRSARRLLLTLFAVVIVIASPLGLQPTVPASGFTQTALDPAVTPGMTEIADGQPVELGLKFSSTTSGTVNGIRFFKGANNAGLHTGSLWTSTGELLARTTFTDETESGWQTAELSPAVSIDADQTYVVSYHSPSGAYSADNQVFGSPSTRGSLSVPVAAGVYSYGAPAFPSSTYRDSNYYVDVTFTPDSTPSPGPSPSPPAGDDEPLPLPRIPWEGGPEYWKQFPMADAAGWDEPGFFPIIAWFNGISSDEEVQYDKSLGINTYSGMWEGTPYSLFEDNDVFWIGDQLNDTFTPTSENWVGNFLDDEVDGRFTPEAGRARLQQRVDDSAGDGRFNYANFTQMVIGTDLPASDAEAYVNDYTDVVSVDMYWYTIPYCSLQPYRDVYLTPVGQENCRTASSYGKTIQSLRVRDAADGKLQPIWQWVENLNGGPGEGPFVSNITGEQLEGAVMNSLIHEARGIAYFNQSMSGPCQGGNIFRQSQVTENFCGAEQIEAARTINSRVAELAPVLNSQSYEYSFGAGLDTMLKSHDGDAYIFGMLDGESRPGERTFTVPPGVRGSTVDVLFEDRTIAVDESGQFTDTFPDEHSYHVYRIPQ